MLNASALGEHVNVVASAASNSQGKMNFFVREAGDTSSLLPGDGSEEITVAVDTIDNLCRDFSQIHIIKIDVEGHEFEVLIGAQHTIVKHRPWVLFELLDEMVVTGRVSLGRLTRFFRELDYVCNWVSHDINEPLLSDKKSTYVLVTPIERLKNKLISPACFCC